MAEKGPAGYRVLSRFQLAAAEAQAGDTDKAVALYDALATDADTDDILKGLATIQAATLRLDTADYAEMERRLKGLIEQGSPWSYSARELLGLSAYRLEQYAGSRKAIQRAHRRPRHALEFARACGHDAGSHRGRAAGVEHHGEVAL